MMIVDDDEDHHDDYDDDNNEYALHCNDDDCDEFSGTHCGEKRGE